MTSILPEVHRKIPRSFYEVFSKRFLGIYGLFPPVVLSGISRGAYSGNPPGVYKIIFLEEPTEFSTIVTSGMLPGVNTGILRGLA